MLPIPPDLKTGFDALLVEKGIPSGPHSDNRKCLRYDLDFAHICSERFEMSSPFCHSPGRCKTGDRREGTG
jgi:hypothetical protein